jgi:hypothetical protein
MTTQDIPCPECKAARVRDGETFDGGYLHQSGSYPSLLHCNFCGAYYQRSLVPVSRAALHLFREVP